MPKRQKIPTPLDYVHFLAGLPAPIEEEEPVGIPVPTPVYMPNPRTLDASAMGLGQQASPFQGGPMVPPPIAPEAPPGFQSSGGFMAPEGGAFG
jgi:hypothetical protein